MSVNCSCSCNHAQFNVTGEPLFRIICHCTICQKVNEAPFADILVFSASHTQVPSTDVVELETYRPPPNVQRGKCVECADLVIEVFSAPVFPKLIMIPRSAFANDAILPEPVAHTFYEKRVSDVNDQLSKYRGYIPSQLGFFKYYLAAKPWSR